MSTPSSLTEVGHFDTQGAAYGVAVSGSYAYVADDSDGLRVIDVSTPSAPVEVGSFTGSVNAFRVAISGTRAYLTNYGGGLHILDVTLPSTPVQVGLHETLALAYDVAATGSHAYVAAYDAGMEIFGGACFGMFSVAVASRGTGSGTTSSDPAGIDCGATCLADFDADAVVTLSADPDPGSVFDGWVSAECSGTGDCVLTMTGDKWVAALLDIEGACGLGDSLELEQMSIDWTQEFEACTSITAGNDFVVASSGDVTFRAGQSVSLDDGFSVAAGATFTVAIDPTVSAP